MQLSGKTALVTGGTDGIGAELIRHLRDKGALSSHRDAPPSGSRRPAPMALK